METNEVRMAMKSNDGQMPDKPILKVRSRTGRLSQIVVTEVNQENFKILWPYIMISIREASFISIDLELSGLGNRQGWCSANINERYNAVREGARTRSIVSLGITTFKLLKRKETREKKRIKFKCQTFNILAFCMDPFIVEPSGLQFLVRNSFDLNRLVKVGVPYYVSSKNQEKNQLRILWEHILERDVPLIFHNGFVDLAFLYQHFYANLPETLSQFVTNISDWFSDVGRVFDSKYLSEYYTKMKASFLEYVFRKCQRENAVEASYLRLYVSVEFDEALLNVSSLSNAIDIVECQLPEGFYQADIKVTFPNRQERMWICSKYATSGFCNLKEKCLFLHNIDAVLDAEELKQNKLRTRRKRRYDFSTKGIRIVEDEASSSNGQDIQNRKANINSDLDSKVRLCKQDSYHREEQPYLNRLQIGCHRAGVDSFMTGFSVAYMSRMTLLRFGIFDPDCANRLPLPGKMVPLIIRKYEHTEKTPDHLERWKPIQIERTRAKQSHLLPTLSRDSI